MKYEKLQIFCYKCGVISHDSRDCEKDRLVSVVNSENARFGSWIGAMSCRGGAQIVCCSEMEGVEMEEQDLAKEDGGLSEVGANKLECSPSGMSCDSASSSHNVDNLMLENSMVCAGDVSMSAMNFISDQKYFVCDMNNVSKSGMGKENQFDSVVRKNIWRRKLISVRDFKDLVRSGKMCSPLSDINCNNVDYFVEFPIEEDVESVKRRLSGEMHNELVENFKAVVLKKNDEVRQG